MKKVFITLVLMALLTTPGCKNPLAASVEKEGDKTRADMIVELNASKLDIYNAFKAEMDKSAQINNDLLTTYMQYIAQLLSAPRY